MPKTPKAPAKPATIMLPPDGSKSTVMLPAPKNRGGRPKKPPRVPKARAVRKEEARKTPPTRVLNGKLPEYVSASDLAALFGVTKQWVNSLTREGILPREGSGPFHLATAAQAYVAHKSEGAQKQNQSTSADSLRDRRAEEIAIKIARQERELIPLTDAMRMQEEAAGLYLSAISGLPARITRIPRDRQRIEAICDEDRLRLSDVFGKLRSGLRTGVLDLEAGEEVDA